MLWIWAGSMVLLWYTMRQWRASTPRRRRVQLLFVLLAAAWLILLGLWVIVPLVASWIGEAAIRR